MFYDTRWDGGSTRTAECDTVWVSACQQESSLLPLNLAVNSEWKQKRSTCLLHETHMEKLWGWPSSFSALRILGLLCTMCIHNGGIIRFWCMQGVYRIARKAPRSLQQHQHRPVSIAAWQWVRASTSLHKTSTLLIHLNKYLWNYLWIRS